MEEIIVPSGIKIGHFNDEYTGVTVIMSEKGCVAGVDVRGGAPGTRETDLLRPEKAMEKINAVVLSGGSAYGLAATCGVMEYMRERGIGYKISKKVVPIVCGAVLFDLNDKDSPPPNGVTRRAKTQRTGMWRSDRWARAKAPPWARYADCAMHRRAAWAPPQSRRAAVW